MREPCYSWISKIALASFAHLCARGPRKSFLVAVACAGASGVAGCAQQPPLKRTAHSKEYFPSSIYGRASPRVVEEGEPVPRGGGVYLVGKPYSVAGQTYYPSEKHYSAVGLASWYGDAFHGRRTANGEVYDRDAISAAHPTMPLPSYARITNLYNNYSMIVRVNDRGPFHPNRIIDVSRRTAEALNFHSSGTARVKVEYVAPASLDGSDDNKLLATLRMNEPASLDRHTDQPTLIAGSAPLRMASIEPARAVSVEPDDAGKRPKDVSRGGQTLPYPVSRAVALNVPLPPVRPFDLVTRPASSGASTKVARVIPH